MADKIYVGNGKTRSFNGGGSIRKITIDVDSILKEFGNHGFVTDQGKRKIVLNVSDRMSPDNYGNDLSVTVDTWHPDNYVPPGSTQLDQQVRMSAPQQPKPFNGFNPINPKPFEQQGAQSGGYSSGGSFEDDIPF